MTKTKYKRNLIWCFPYSFRELVHDNHDSMAVGRHGIGMLRAYILSTSWRQREWDQVWHWFLNPQDHPE